MSTHNIKFDDKISFSSLPDKMNNFILFTAIIYDDCLFKSRGGSVYFFFRLIC